MESMRVLVLSRNASLYSTSRLVLSGQARGHVVDVIDPLELQIVVARRSSTLYWRGKRLPRYDAIIPRIGASITRYGLAAVRQFERQGHVVLNHAEAIGCSRDKMRALQLLATRRIAVPRTVYMRGLMGIDRALEQVGGCPVIVKLQQGTQGIGTMLAESPEGLYALLETLWAMGQEIVLQEYVRASHGRDVRALVVGGRVVAAMRRRAPPGEFRSNLHRGARGEAVKLSRPYRRCAQRAAEVLGLDVAGVDMLEGEDGPVVVELNSSPGLEGIEAASGIDVAGRIMRHLEDRVLEA